MQPTPKPTLAEVRALARQLPPASQRKLAAELFAAGVAAEVPENRPTSLANTTGKTASS